MSDDKPILRANFINRKTGSVIKSMPISNRISLNTDMRQLTDTFDFDFLYKIDQDIDIDSHDFVEFFFKNDNGTIFQVSCGFIETLVSDTGAATHRIQANGRDFLGHLLLLPFLFAKPVDLTTVKQFMQICLQGSYLNQYLSYKFGNANGNVIDRGIYPGNIIVQELTDAKRGPVLQNTLDAIYNTVYMNRFGQAVIYGRSNRLQYSSNNILSEFKDSNVESMQYRSEFSKVFSTVRILYSGGQGNVDYALQSTKDVTNPDPDAAQIFNPEVRTFNTGDLITTPGNNDLGNKMYLLAQSIMRKSNQFLRQFVVKTNKPYYVDNSGVKTWFEKGQVFYIFNETRNFFDQMMLVGISYEQDENKLSLQLLFVGVDTLV